MVELNASEKVWIGATAVFNAPQKRTPTERERRKVCDVMATMEDYDDDEIAHVIMGLICILGDRLARKLEQA